MSNWDTFYLGMAEYVAAKSKDPGSKVGCVITRPDNTVASLGYNGFPRGADDVDLNNRDRKIARTIHAELNAVLNSKESLESYTAYVTHPICCQCAAVLAQAGIKEVVCRRPSSEFAERWKESMEEAQVLLFETGVYYVER